ncbi:M23 family metallopeptidase [Dactylosporangium sp. NPDC050688]|uniref:M23 family metallopeptidase n=1 Tax=Dactylosporangium sp. NPDC050688 TaxID=3157217 RepID=UPI0033F8BDFF
MKKIVAGVLAIFAALLAVVLVCMGTGMSLMAVLFAGAVNSSSSLLIMGETTAGCDTDILGSDLAVSGANAGDGETYATLSEAQRRNSITIIGVAKGFNVPVQGWVIALMTAQQEASLLNKASRRNPGSLNYPHDGVDAGDHDSVGLFQQRDAWGPMAARMDPAMSAAMFFTGGEDGQRGLFDVKGWQAMEPGDAAQEVQVSAYPDRYARWERLARDIVANLGASAPSINVGGVGFIDGDSNGNGNGNGNVGGNVGGTLCGNGLGLDCPETKFPEEKEALTPDALRVLRCIHQNFPTIVEFHGIGERNGPSDHPSGRAIDAMVPGWNTAAGNQLGWKMAEWLRTNAKALGVKYLIWDVKIWNIERDAEGWRVFTNHSGDPTTKHQDHVHISVYGNAATGFEGTWTAPLRAGYRISTHFGVRDAAHTDHDHEGVDLAPFGPYVNPPPIYAVAAGEVIFAGAAGGFGNLIKIRHADGTVTYYAHQSKFSVKEGERVTAGKQIGYVGSTGNSTGDHLHFEVHPKGGEPVDPERFMAKRGVKL